jgi:hypothetical protein
VETIYVPDGTIDFIIIIIVVVVVVVIIIIQCHHLGSIDLKLY